MTSSTIATLELSEIKQERDALKEDLHAAKLELFSLRSEFQVCELFYKKNIVSIVFCIIMLIHRVGYISDPPILFGVTPKKNRFKVLQPQHY